MGKQHLAICNPSKQEISCISQSPPLSQSKRKSWHLACPVPPRRTLPGQVADDIGFDCLCVQCHDSHQRQPASYAREEQIATATNHQQTRVYPYPLGAGSARPNPKMGAPDPENPFISSVFYAQRGIETMVSEGARPWGRGRSGDCETKRRM